MDKIEFLRNMYDDFYGDTKLNNAIEKQEDKQTDNVKVQNKEEYVKNTFEAIDKLHIDDKSKQLLKKIIEYMKRYNEKEEKQYISFNMCVYSKDAELVEKIQSILFDTANFFAYIKKGSNTAVSLYDIDDANKLSNAFSNNSLVVLKDFDALNIQDKKVKSSVINRLKEIVTQNENEVLTILNARSKEILDQAFESSLDTLKKFNDFEIYYKAPDANEVFYDILANLKEKMDISSETEQKLQEYINNTYENNELAYSEYRNNLVDSILFNKEIPSYEQDKSMDEIFEELNSLVGLTKVKQAIQDLVSLMELRKKTKDDLNIKNTNLHMVFLGNPGTGKTTVARLIAQILYHLKYIKQNKLIEVSSKDLVAEYVGQTAPKTMAVIEKAMGGVLFIDEAYSLASGSGNQNSYNEEAIATLIQAMENNRDNLVVIFAGYTKEMQKFLDSNSGIVSRIGYTMEFEDYTEDELVQIFKGMVTKSGFSITKEALDKALSIIKEYKDYKNFGNARFARNLYEKTIIKHASNTKDTKDKKKLKTIEVEDINTDNLMK